MSKFGQFFDMFPSTLLSEGYSCLSFVLEKVGADTDEEFWYLPAMSYPQPYGAFVTRRPATNYSCGCG
jgi:hypothetical protein